uniref:Lachesin n=1 Tax=Cacopsylla melanoneura TaxID=428564 RepID=A0A8D8VD53_9HEMI
MMTWSEILSLIWIYVAIGDAYQPEFAEPIVNLSVAVGRDATFRCLVHHLGGYRVGWVKADTKAIQAIHEHVITHNPRVGVSHTDHSTWNLHIKGVQEEDRGHYMCQINTDPMKSQMGYLDVWVPPDIINEESSGDIMAPEGGTVIMVCKARGYPRSHITWKREDGTDIIIKDANSMVPKSKVGVFSGETMKLYKVSRSEMGTYLCIASNGVPPSVSKRITLNVHFHPVIHVPNQLVGAPIETDVTLECYVEAYPKSINYWVRDLGEMVISSERYEVESISRSIFDFKMRLTIRRITKHDLGSYKCIAKNSLGEVESSIRLYEIPGSSRKKDQTAKYEDNLTSEDTDGPGEEDLLTPEEDYTEPYEGSKNKIKTTHEVSKTINQIPHSGHPGVSPTRRTGQSQLTTLKTVKPAAPNVGSRVMTGIIQVMAFLLYISTCL